MSTDSVNRFSYRAENYDRFRPNYPAGLVTFIHAHVGITAEHTIADIAAGTGIFTEQLAAWGNPVYAVEPNPYMRRKAHHRLAAYGNCFLVEGTAESTNLPDHSIDLLVSAQAFHWFDPLKTKVEFKRVGRGDVHVAIVWNLRNTATDFEAGYEAVIRTYGIDYLKVSQQKMDKAEVLAFFAPASPVYRVFGHMDFLTFEQLRGRTLSYSYMPDEKSPLWSEMLDALEALFDRHQRDGQVRLSYKTRLFIGRI